jgi:hypothetical protein
MSTTSWKKDASGNFAGGTNWTSGVPTNSFDAVISVGGAYAITSSVTETMASLTIGDKSATLDITGGTFSIQAGGGGNAGTINVTAPTIFELGFDGDTTTFSNTGKINLTGPNTSFEIDGTVKLTGTGSLNLNGANIVSDGTDSSDFVNCSTITTAGTVTIGDIPSDSKFTLDNFGRIYAMGGTLTLNTGGNTIINQSTGVLTADGSTVEIDSNVNQVSASSQIRAQANSSVYINDVSVSGGQIDARADGAFIYLNDATIENNASLDSGNTTGEIVTEGLGSILDGTTSVVINTANLVVADNTALTLKGTILNADYWTGVSAINVDSTGSETDLWIDATVTLTDDLPGNSGLIVMSGDAVIDGGGDGAVSGTLDNTDNTIMGAGNIGLGDGSLALTNAGTIDASGSSALTINIGNYGVAATVINTGGTLEATGSGGLSIEDTGISGGRAEIGAGSKLDLLSGSLSNVAVSFQNNNSGGGLYSGSLIASLGSTLNSGTLGSGTTVAGFAGATATNSDEIDLQSQKFSSTNSSASWTQGTAGNSGEGILAVTNGHNTVDITLMGTYAAGTADFHVASDGGSGTLITTTNHSANNLV